MDKKWDCIIVGAGAAGLYCGIVAGRRGRRVLILDHSTRIAEKIRISGGGRCNFTNRDLSLSHPEQSFLSLNPRFCKSALARYRPQDFIQELDRFGLSYHEKHKGQLFCDQGSGAIIEMLLSTLQETGGSVLNPITVQDIEAKGKGFKLNTDAGSFSTDTLVIATGGLSIPQIGASDFGYRIARQFNHSIVEPRPALVPLKFDANDWAPFAELAGIGVPVHIRVHENKKSQAFDEDLLFTHRGLSGPAVLQISSYWNPGESIAIDLCPASKLDADLLEAKRGSKQRILSHLGEHLPARLAKTWLKETNLAEETLLQDLKDDRIRALGNHLKEWVIQPTGSEGFKKAEVTRGGVNTKELSSQTMESQQQPGLYFIGEVVDVTGWLGGYNFQWAWASAHAAGSVV